MLIGIMYSRLLKETNFKIALTVQLLSWKAGLKQVNIQNLTMSQAIKYIYINLNVGYGNETNLLLQ